MNLKAEVKRIKNFKYLLISSGISFFGNGMQFIANSWLAFKITGEATAVGWLFALSLIPNLFLAPLLGVFIDRWNKKFIALSVHLIRAIVLATLVYLFFHGIQNIFFLFFMIFILTLCDGVYNSLSPILIRAVTPKNLLLPANSLISTWNQIGAIIGTGVGGILLSISDYLVFTINAISFILAAYLVLKLKIEVVKETNQSRKHIIKEIKVGLEYITKNTNIISIYLIILITNFTIRVMNVTLSPFIVKVIGSDVIGFGMVDAAFALGAVLGNYFIVKVVLRFGEINVISMGLFSIGSTLFMFSQSGNIYVAFVFYLLVGISYQTRVLLVTLIQDIVETSVLGRVQSTYFFFDCLIGIFSFIGIGYLSSTVSPKWTYLLPVFLLITASVYAKFKLNSKLNSKNTSEVSKVVYKL